ncbi:MAG: hypothetical protein NVSMB1_15070 [Polyangiales bacterium]
MRRSRFLLSLLVVLPVACAKESPNLSDDVDAALNDASPSDGSITCTGAEYAARGAQSVGLASLDMGGVPVAIWYPTKSPGTVKVSYDLRDWLAPSERSKIPDSAKPSHEMDAYADLPPADGKFPVVLFSHGLGGYRFQSSFLMTHLASWGFIVIAPEHPERNLTAALSGKFAGDRSGDQLRGALTAVRADSRFADHLDMTHVAAMGHSAGGGAVSTISPDDVIKAWVMLASPGLGAGPSGKPSLMMCGTTDEIAVCKQVNNSWMGQPSPTGFVSLNGVGHVGFTDLCTIAADRGGVVQLSKDYGVMGANDLLIKLASDGCRPTDRPARDGWSVIDP